MELSPIIDCRRCSSLDTTASFTKKKKKKSFSKKNCQYYLFNFFSSTSDTIPQVLPNTTGGEELVEVHQAKRAALGK